MGLEKEKENEEKRKEERPSRASWCVNLLRTEGSAVGILKVNSVLPVSGSQCVYSGRVGIGHLLFLFSTLFVVERFRQSTGEGQRGNEP